jgi:hypothetical protein
MPHLKESKPFSVADLNQQIINYQKVARSHRRSISMDRPHLLDAAGFSDSSHQLSLEKDFEDFEGDRFNFLIAINQYFLLTQYDKKRVILFDPLRQEALSLSKEDADTIGQDITFEEIVFLEKKADGTVVEIKTTTDNESTFVDYIASKIRKTQTEASSTAEPLAIVTQKKIIEALKDLAANSINVDHVLHQHNHIAQTVDHIHDIKLALHQLEHASSEEKVNFFIQLSQHEDKDLLLKEIAKTLAHLFKVRDDKLSFQSINHILDQYILSLQLAAISLPMQKPKGFFQGIVCGFFASTTFFSSKAHIQRQPNVIDDQHLINNPVITSGLNKVGYALGLVIGLLFTLGSFFIKVLALFVKTGIGFLKKTREKIISEVKAAAYPKFTDGIKDGVCFYIGATQNLKNPHKRIDYWVGFLAGLGSFCVTGPMISAVAALPFITEVIGRWMSQHVLTKIMNPVKNKKHNAISQMDRDLLDNLKKLETNI